MNGGFSQQVRVLANTMAESAPPSTVTIDAASDPGAWETAYAHSPTVYCSCCGSPARDCLIVHSGTAEGEIGLGDYPPEAAPACGWERPDEDLLS